MAAEIVSQQSALSSLQKRWLVFFGGCSLFLLSGFICLNVVWVSEYALRWVILTAGVIIYQLLLLRKNLVFNHRLNDEILLPELGIGNTITLTRGILFAGLTGFLFSPRPVDGLAWIPAVFFTVGSLIDFLDGYAARVTNRVTKLGEILDMSLDGWGMLVASFLAVQYGQVPAWYILIGLARYLFLGGLWLWEKLGLKIYDLPPNKARRPLAGLQMGFTFVILWPVFSPPGTQIAAIIFSVPFLAGFTWDWLVVSGISRPVFFEQARSIKEFIFGWFPIFVRIGIPILMVWQYVAHRLITNRGNPVYSIGQDISSTLNFIMLFFDILIPVCLMFGVAGRIAAVLGLVFLGFHQIQASLSIIQVSLLWSYGVLLYLGTGKFSLWEPENRLISQRAGEK